MSVTFLTFLTFLTIRKKVLPLSEPTHSPPIPRRQRVRAEQKFGSAGEKGAQGEKSSVGTPSRLRPSASNVSFGREYRS